MKDVGFSINLYDREGDVYQKGIYIHIDDDTILRFENKADLKDFYLSIFKCIEEIAESYPEID